MILPLAYFGVGKVIYQYEGERGFIPLLVNYICMYVLRNIYSITNCVYQIRPILKTLQTVTSHLHSCVHCARCEPQVPPYSINPPYSESGNPETHLLVCCLVKQGGEVAVGVFLTPASLG